MASVDIPTYPIFDLTPSGCDFRAPNVEMFSRFFGIFPWKCESFQQNLKETIVIIKENEISDIPTIRILKHPNILIEFIEHLACSPFFHFHDF